MFFTLITSELDLASKTMLRYLQEYKKFNELENFYFTSSLYDNISIFISKNQLILTDCFNELYKKINGGQIRSLTHLRDSVKGLKSQ